MRGCGVSRTSTENSWLWSFARVQHRYCPGVAKLTGSRLALGRVKHQPSRVGRLTTGAQFPGGTTAQQRAAQAKERFLKRASALRSSREWSDDDYDVLADGLVVGRIMKAARKTGRRILGCGRSPTTHGRDYISGPLREYYPGRLFSTSLNRSHGCGPRREVVMPRHQLWKHQPEDSSREKSTPAVTIAITMSRLPARHGIFLLSAVCHFTSLAVKRMSNAPQRDGGG
jgi:hypothetical protein